MTTALAGRGGGNRNRSCHGHVILLVLDCNGNSKYEQQ